MTTAQLGAVCEILMGQAPPGETYNDKGVGLPLIAGASDFGSITPKPARFASAPAKRSRPGDLLLCIRATIGDLNWADQEYCLGRGVAALRPIPRLLHARYLWHVIEWLSPNLSAMGRGATFKQISRDQIAGLEIPLPPLAEQKRTAAVLDQADEMRRTRQAALAAVKSFVPATFESMFQQALAEGTTVSMGSIVEDFRYGTSNKSGNSGHPTLRIPNILGGMTNIDDLKYVQVEEAEFRRLRLSQGDLLFVRTNGNPAYVGRCAVIDDRLGKGSEISVSDFIYASYLIRARFTQGGSFNPVFVQSYLSLPQGRRQIREFARTSAGQFNINTDGLSSLRIPKAPFPIQCDFAARVVDIAKLEATHTAHLTMLETLFASLQHRAFRGELPTRQAERDLAEAAQ